MAQLVGSQHIDAGQVEHEIGPLLGQQALSAAREARSAYTPPSCGVSEAARTLGEQQSALIAGLPDRPNERLVYSCTAKSGAPAK